MAHYGIGHLTAVTILAELGDARRFCSSRDAVRYAGLDITVKQSDRRRAPGHLSRQGPPAPRWALYEAAQSARRQSSPDRDYYRQAAERLGGNRACLAVARKLLKRSYHTPRELGDQALQPARPSACARSPHPHRRTAAGSRHRPAATPAWTAPNDRAAAQPHPAGTTPINHHLAGPPHRRVEDRNTARRPRAPQHPYRQGRGPPPTAKTKSLTRAPSQIRTTRACSHWQGAHHCSRAGTEAKVRLAAVLGAPPEQRRDP